MGQHRVVIQKDQDFMKQNYSDISKIIFACCINLPKLNSTQNSYEKYIQESHELLPKSQILFYNNTLRD